MTRYMLSVHSREDAAPEPMTARRCSSPTSSRRILNTKSAVVAATVKSGLLGGDRFRTPQFEYGSASNDESREDGRPPGTLFELFSWRRRPTYGLPSSSSPKVVEVLVIAVPVDSGRRPVTSAAGPRSCGLRSRLVLLACPPGGRPCSLLLWPSPELAAAASPSLLATDATGHTQALVGSLVSRRPAVTARPARPEPRRASRRRPPVRLQADRPCVLRIMMAKVARLTSSRNARATRSHRTFDRRFGW